MRELRTAAIAVVVMTLVLGVAYPLAMTGVAQVLFPGSSDGSLVKRDGQTVGSKLIGQDFSKNAGYFQSRPSVTDYNPSGTVFNNQGPNQQDLADQLEGFVKDYLKREKPFTPSLTAAQIPPDAVTTSASGVDPQISEANARIQANRVARERGLPLDRVMQIVDDHASRPLFGLGGPKSVNVLETNLALDQETS
jgi:potassium-transporting ATPase KdpC subunit